jgi:hypothetical protein
MKKTRKTDSTPEPDELRAEYDFDYRNARPNRFAGSISSKQILVRLDPDVSQVFTSSESVNAILRALITAMPKSANQDSAPR